MSPACEATQAAKHIPWGQTVWQQSSQAAGILPRRFSVAARELVMWWFSLLHSGDTKLTSVGRSKVSGFFTRRGEDVKWNGALGVLKGCRGKD